jgi:Plasmid pRiA4b ORF-3-like protein
LVGAALRALPTSQTTTDYEFLCLRNARFSVYSLALQQAQRRFEMAGTDTFIFRAALQGNASIYRDIELDPAKSLYALAEAIVSAFNFDFDHAFGFYTGLTPAKMHKTFPKYELFADMGDADPRVLGVKKIKMSQAFPEVEHTILFLFDYGDEWLFRVTLRTVGKRSGKTRYPRIVATSGEAPAQYPADDDDPDDRPSFGINPLTGEKIWFEK